MGKEFPGGGISSLGTLRFGPFEFDVRAGELTKNGSKIRLQEQPFQVLRMLLVRPGDIVLREEIRQNLWPNDTVVEFDNGFNGDIEGLRDALGDSVENSLRESCAGGLPFHRQPEWNPLRRRK
jgi:DNA-binding winged helix-turn-helix (wHTH) protein